MVVAHHLIWTLYGFWLPNDPRGSNSREVRVAELLPLGKLHEGRKKIQPASKTIRLFYEKADRLLRDPRLPLDDEDILLLAAALEKTIKENQYTCYACAIMPDHLHILIRKHKHQAEQMLDAFQYDGREALIEARRRDIDHPVWGGPGWKVFLDSREDIEIGRPKQTWEFVQKYDGWLPGRRR